MISNLQDLSSLGKKNLTSGRQPNATHLSVATNKVSSGYNLLI